MLLLIGIGAPVQYFLPAVGKKLNAEVIVPEYAAVGNHRRNHQQGSY
jgi:hypothetical protein